MAIRNGFYGVQVLDLSGWRTMLAVPEGTLHPGDVVEQCAVFYTKIYRQVRTVGPSTIKQNPVKVLLRWRDGEKQ